MIVLDTNVLSEMMRPEPAEAVRLWLARQPVAQVFTTAVTEAELLYGVALLPDGRRRDMLRDAVIALFAEDLAGRVLPFDSAAAAQYAALATGRRRSGRPIALADAQIAAIARSRGAAVATRNVADFEGCGIGTVDPWNA